MACVLLATATRAETQIVEATIAQIEEAGMILTVGTEALPVQDGIGTRYWRAKAEAKREAFKVGDRVFVRLKVDADPPQVREIADKPTWEWIDKIRKEPQVGSVEKVDDKYVTLKFGDGATFRYRATAKSEVKLAGKATASLADLTAGQKVWAKGRTLPTLDTWLVLVSDQPIEGKPAATKKTTVKKTKEKPLPSTGKLSGTILALIKPLSVFDAMAVGKTLHITYNNETKFYLDGKACRAEVMLRNMDFSATYRRDKFGRIIALRVDLFTRS